MSNCINNCKLCKNVVLSQSITFAAGNVVVNLPADTYANKEKYCIVFAQAIPTTATVTAPVVFTIGTGTTQYPFLNKCCEPIVANQIRTRRIYSTKVVTSANAFKYVGECPLPSSASEEIPSLPTGGGA